MNKIETKLQKFERIAERRTNEAIKKVRLIKHLANRNNYDFSDRHASKIISALKKEVDMLEREFKTNSSQEEIDFKF
ncbi:histidine kinase [Sporosarcina globispora]|uniref:Histidine kinase n=1 Tax=Sporosarcina globispora TaxID=1459 RepID=A0A0M0GDI4_SPOGL|nr:hypothetical protein [Sporosarcina globispora]KON87960.1 histidine kinase [Sporosarcina globispora]